MEHSYSSLGILFVAVLIDLLIGDPKCLPHPVRLIGKLLDSYEQFVRRSRYNLISAGLIACILFPTSAWIISSLLLAIPYLGVLIAIYLSFAGLALGGLLKESRSVADAIDRGHLDQARHSLAMLVSRDTGHLDENGLRQTLAETLSENLNDGFIAPMFYLILFGPAGLWAYKTVSTMDSMWGYKNDQFRRLGMGGARLDDILAFIPARITACIIICINLSLTNIRRFSVLYKKVRTDAIKMESPNAGWPMAATAWSLEGQMGGVAIYWGQAKEKPILGPPGRIWTKGMIEQQLKESLKVGLVFSVAFSVAVILF